MSLRVIVCPYCHEQAELKDSSAIYGTSYGLVWICRNFPKCDSYVGVHQGTTTPKGTLANRELRELRKECHALFDPLWMSGQMTRPKAYRFLQAIMGLPKFYAHIGKFNEQQCRDFLLRFPDDKVVHSELF